MARILRSFISGLAIGSVGAWWLLSSPTFSSSDQDAKRAPDATTSAWTWRSTPNPPPLAASDAHVAITAWRALRAPDGGPAGFAVRAEQLRALLVRLPAAFFPRLLDTFGDGKLDSDDLALRQLAFTHWIDLDPSSAARWAAKQPAHHGLARDALRAWSARDAQAAAAWVCALSDEKIVLTLATGSLQTLAEQDASAALSLITARGERLMKKLLPSLLPLLARQDPASTVRDYAPLLWDRGLGSATLRPALSAWFAADPNAALAWLIAQPRARGVSFSSVLPPLDPAAGNHASLANALATLPGVPERQTTLANLLYLWCGADAPAALAWLNRLSEPGLRTILLERALNTTNYEHSPLNLLPLALALPTGDKRDEHIGSVLFNWSQKEPTAALRWIQEHASDPTVAAVAFGAQAAALGAIARDEPATAITEWQALPPGPLKTMAVYLIGESWGRTQPAEAIRWQEDQSLALGTPLSIPSEQIFSWARQDGPSALRWAETRSGQFQTFALESLVSDQRDRAAPSVAVDLYAQIQDPALRTRYVAQHVTEWLTKDPAAARAWLEKSTALTPEQAAALRTPAN